MVGCSVATLQNALGKSVVLANDANCLAVSEAADGAAARAAVVFAVVLGTGVGGGLAVDGKVLNGANGLAGEWGHSPLPAHTRQEGADIRCWCGKLNCIELWVSGTGFRRCYREASGRDASGMEIVAAMRAGEREAQTTFGLWIERLGRSLATVVNVIDPEVLVFGGGMSNIPEIYSLVPPIIATHAFSDHWSARLQPAKWGDSSGVRGAARL